MAKQSNQKLKLLYLLRILLKRTDSESGLTLSQISAELAKYNISAARKSLYDDIEALRLFGIDVCVKRDRYVRYYIDKREFSSVETKYMIDALESFASIDPTVANQLIEKIVRVWGVKGRSYTQTNSEPLVKMPRVICDEFDKNVEIINTAISQNKKIRFKEFLWNPQKQRILKNDGKITQVTPIRLINDKKYRLCAFDGVRVQEYLVDRLLDVEILNEAGVSSSAYKEFFDKNIIDIDYANVRIEFDSSFASEVFERFGLGVTVLSIKEETFEFSIKVKLDEDFYCWLFTNSKYIRKISPDRVREEYKERILMALEDANP